MIIFDFDGTIADTISLGILLINDYSAKFKYKKIDREKMNGLPALELMKLMEIKVYRLPYLAWYLRRLLKERASEIKMNPGIRELLESLRASGQQLGIITSNSYDNVSSFLKRNGIDSYFSYVKTKVPLLKKKKALSKAMRQLKSNFVYVGDELRDVEACRKNNIPIVSVAWGFNSAESLERINPGFVARNAEEAISLIKELLGKQSL
ncbi:MAG: HAD-IA family hydrolase [Treponemataceae bacterium]|nr:HAD-IA family hydrolase [Treponemataceae bacterium]